MGNKIQLFGELESVAVDKKLVDAVQVKDSAWIDPATNSVSEETQSAINAALKKMAENAANSASGLSIDYDKSKQVIGLYRGDDEESRTLISSFSSVDFIKDGMLREVRGPYTPNADEEWTVRLEDDLTEVTIGAVEKGKTYLGFIWNTGDLSKVDAFYKTSLLDVSKLVDVYTANGGIRLDGKQFSIEKDPDSEGFLTVSANGLKLSGVKQAINDSKTSVIGESGDASTANTIFGAKAYADSVARAAPGYNLTKTVSTGNSTALWANHTDPNATANEAGYKVDKGSIVVLWQLEEIDVQITHKASSPVTVSWSGITPSPQSPLLIEYMVIAK